MTNAELKAALEQQMKINQQLSSQFQQQQAAFDELRNSVNTKPNNSVSEANVKHEVSCWKNTELDIEILAARSLGAGELKTLDRGLELVKKYNNNPAHLHQSLVFSNLNSFTKIQRGVTTRYHRTAKGYFTKVA